MGLPWLHVQAAYVRPGYVGVQVLAVAKPLDDELDARPDDPGSAPPDSGTDESGHKIRL